MIKSKKAVPKKTFQKEAHKQGGLSDPLPAKTESGTGLPYKKPRKSLAPKAKIKVK